MDWSDEEFDLDGDGKLSFEEYAYRDVIWEEDEKELAAYQRKKSKPKKADPPELTAEQRRKGTVIAIVFMLALVAYSAIRILIALDIF